MNITKPSLQLRAFTSVLIGGAFLALVSTGAVLFISPPGRVANWTGWNVLGLSKHEWSALHICFSAVFLVAAGFHLAFNFRPFLNYFKARLTRRMGFRWEWLAALALCGVVFAGTRAGVPPFSTLLNWNDQIKRSWEAPQTAAPIPHAELLTLRELAEKTGVPLETALQRLAAGGVAGASAEAIVATLAQQNRKSAQQILEIMQRIPSPGRGGGGRGKGGGFGKKAFLDQGGGF